MNPTLEEYAPRLERGKRNLIATQPAAPLEATRRVCGCGYKVRGNAHERGEHHSKGKR